MATPPEHPDSRTQLSDRLAHLSAIIDALATPIAIFNANRELVQSNLAYAALWRLDPNWLRVGMDERKILDKLRTEEMLPPDPDYQAWRARHLQSYTLSAPRESEPWHLPDGRTLQVISAPAGPRGGVIYVFEDITDQLQLKSQNRALLDIHRSTLDALTEGVAVFGTNGRLTLSNPRFWALWGLPRGLLDVTPHIDQILKAVSLALPEDGAGLWRDLKRAIVDLNPSRTDRSARISRADGKLIDYAITRLPDGQTMMTFVDVTESANYQNVLRERNEALMLLDRLKLATGDGNDDDREESSVLRSIEPSALNYDPADNQTVVIPEQRPGLVSRLGVATSSNWQLRELHLKLNILR
ncbi:MAG: PAS-domain containing protein [Devosia sp.]